MATTGFSVAHANAELVAHCGASEGRGYFFFDELFNPNGPAWETDGISGGRIILVREGDNWDILFGDAVGSFGYRQDGATVVLLSNTGDYITVGAFTENYVETYTFNLRDNEVVWTCHKTGPIPKVAIYRADCG
ncbi:hypothetical protein [Rhodophyticola porphyridii]|nr:hypothetical protein [Rhodophyticola porphyridii]